ncbi:hypothetical protein GUJ93_ZPchr0005g16230 [Zizania palustris]|uniref:Uncharacterized protein n=1 Tax=Zizania palustris TaxID=103762 RepID=A0A8J5SPR7_ZIZPA|nr:hypothetical protein GUJ93_ZPchr0005g16230 [Zizania palustris]
MSAPKPSKKQKTSMISDLDRMSPSENMDVNENVILEYNTPTLDRPMGRKKEKEKLWQCADHIYFEALNHLWDKKKVVDVKELKKEERYNQAYAFVQEKLEHCIQARENETRTRKGCTRERKI